MPIWRKEIWIAKCTATAPLRQTIKLIPSDDNTFTSLNEFRDLTVSYRFRSQTHFVEDYFVELSCLLLYHDWFLTCLFIWVLQFSHRIHIQSKLQMYKDIEKTKNKISINRHPTEILSRKKNLWYVDLMMYKRWWLVKVSASAHKFFYHYYPTKILKQTILRRDVLFRKTSSWYMDNDAANHH